MNAYPLEAETGPERNQELGEKVWRRPCLRALPLWRDQPHKINTVELVVERKELPAPRHITVDDAIVPEQISYGERELGRMAKTLGGKWDPDVNLWYIRYGAIKGPELEKHILLDANLKKGGW